LAKLAELQLAYTEMSKLHASLQRRLELERDEKEMAKHDVALQSERVAAQLEHLQILVDDNRALRSLAGKPPATETADPLDCRTRARGAGHREASAAV